MTEAAAREAVVSRARVSRSHLRGCLARCLCVMQAAATAPRRDWFRLEFSKEAAAHVTAYGVQ